jgi:hypothetical protein
MTTKQRDNVVAALSAMNETLVAEVNFHRATKAGLLAAAKFTIEQGDRDANRLEDGTPNRTAECWKSYNGLVAAIAAAEEPAP